MTYHFETMAKARIVCILTLVAIIFDTFILPKIAFYSVLSWLWGIAAILATVLFIAVNANLFPENGVIWEYGFRKKYAQVCAKTRVVVNDAAPRYSRLTATYNLNTLTNLRFEIHGLTGINIDRWQMVMPEFAHAFGVAHMHATEFNGRVILQSAKPPQKRTNGNTDDISERLRVVPVGTQPNNSDEIFRLPLLWTHILIGGKSGAGKGSWIWSVPVAIVELIRDGFVELYGADPKRLELGLNIPLFKDYATEDKDIVEMLEDAAKEMKARAQRWQGRSRKVNVTREDPLCIIIIDELMYLAKLMPDVKLRKRANEAIMTILVMGRAIGYTVIAAIQDPRKNVLDFRDLFPTKVALRLDKPMVDLVLGEGMWEAGAHCEEILPFTNAGLGYALLEDENTPTLVQAFWQSDETIRSL